MTFTYTPITQPSLEARTDIDKVRLLVNDVDESTAVFQDEEIELFLELANNFVLLAAAQAIDTNADNEVLASKVLKTQDLSTDGAKLADILHKRAAALRQQHIDMLEVDGAFIIVHPDQNCAPELTEPWQY